MSSFPYKCSRARFLRRLSPLGTLPARRSTILSTKVNLPPAMNSRACCGANLVMPTPEFGRLETCVLRRVDGSDQKPCGEGAMGVPPGSCRRGLMCFGTSITVAGSQDFLPRSTPCRNCPIRHSVANRAKIDLKLTVSVRISL